MTVNELRDKINEQLSNHSGYSQMHVDHKTYANVCQFIFDKIAESDNTGSIERISIAIGLNNGIMFKGFELLLDHE
jgi:hypothetical protein